MSRYDCEGPTHRFLTPVCKCGAYRMREDGSLTMNRAPSFHQPDCTWRPDNLWEVPPRGCCAVTGKERTEASNAALSTGGSDASRTPPASQNAPSETRNNDG